MGVIPEGSEIKIDLNGHTLTNNRDHTITNYGTLIITDSSVEGTVDNVTDQKAALYNEEGSSVTLKGSTFTRSKENGKSALVSEGNSYCTLINRGDMNIYEGVTVTLDGVYSGMILNGWKSGTDSSPDKKAILNIEGGYFSGGSANIENWYCGYVYIYDGFFEKGGSNAVLNYNVTHIENGTVISNFKRNDDTAKGLIYLLHGEYTGDILDEGDTNVMGGTFSNRVPSGALPKGYTCEQKTIDGERKYIVVSVQPSEDNAIYIGSSESLKGSNPTEQETMTKITTQFGSTAKNILLVCHNLHWLNCLYYFTIYCKYTNIFCLYRVIYRNNNKHRCYALFSK